MGFDNDCILNIQSLAGEYFCPVCHLLVYPNEALQAQCTHLYCKPCLTYVVSTTHACPYDGYRVTEADSKPLLESNKALADTIGKIQVHCLYYRTGCTWQGPLSDCTPHCSTCAFGESPVQCNRCGIQIVHRQVQEHAQNCPGVQSQAQQPAAGQNVTSTGSGAALDEAQTAGQTVAPASQTQATQTSASSVSTQDTNQQANSATQPQAAQAAMPTPEQWYQQQQQYNQQYQQYYQQYPVYDPYQQQYQYYYQYPQAVQQYQQPPMQAYGQAQAQVYGQAQPQPQLPAQQQGQLNVQPHPQPLTQAPSQAVQPQAQPQAQPAVNTKSQVQPAGQAQSQMHAQNQGPPSNAVPYNQSQPLPQVQPYAQQQPLPQQMPVPQYQQAHPQMQHPYSQPYPQSQPQHYPHALSQAQVQAPPHSQPTPQAAGYLPSQVNQPMNPSAQPQAQNAVTGYQSYPQPQLHPQAQVGAHQMPTTVAQQQPQYPGQMQGQFPSQASQIRPPQPYAAVSNQQQPPMLSAQGQAPTASPAQQLPVYPQAQQAGYPFQQRPGVQAAQQAPAQQYMQQQSFPGQSPFMQAQLYPQGPSQTQPQAALPSQHQQNYALPHGAQPNMSQSYAGRQMVPQGTGSQPYVQTAGPAGPGHVRPIQSQTYPMRTNSQLLTSDHQAGHAQDYLKTASSEMLRDQTVEQSVQNQNDHNEKAGDVVGPSAAGSQVDEMKKVKSENGMEEAADGNETKRDMSMSSVSEHPGSKQVVGTHSKAVETGEQECTPGTNENTAGGISEPSSSAGTNKGVAEDGKDFKKAEGGDLKHIDGSKVGGSVSASILPQPHLHGSNSFPPIDQGRHQLQPMHYGPSGQQRPGFPSMPQSMPHPGNPQQSALRGPPNQLRPQGPGQVPRRPPFNAADNSQPSILNHPAGAVPHENTPAGILGFGSSGAIGRPGSVGHYQDHVPPYQAGQPQNSHGEPFVGPSLAGQRPGAFDSHGSMVGREPLHRPDIVQQRPPYPSDLEKFPVQRPGYFDDRLPDSHSHAPIERGPYGPAHPSVQPGAVKFSGPLAHDPTHAAGMRDERFRPFPEENLKTFSHREFEDDWRKFPRPPPLEAGPSKFGTQFPSSRPLDHGPHQFGVDALPRPFEKGPHGLDHDPGVKMDSGVGSGPSRFLPPLHPNDAGERARPLGFPDDIGRPDFGSCPGPAAGSGFGQHRLDDLPSRSPGRDYGSFPSRKFGGYRDIDGNESRSFEGSKPYNFPREPFGKSAHESRFPVPPNHLHRGELDVPGNLRMGEPFFGGPHNQDMLPGHLRRGEHMGPHNLHLGEGTAFGRSAGPSRIGERPLAGNFPQHLPFGESFGGEKLRHPLLGEPGYRGCYSFQPYAHEGGFYPGEMEPFDNPRKRKPGSIMCRICKVECGTVEGLDLHSQSREHQRKAMEMVLSIKQQNKKKTSKNQASVEEGRDGEKPKASSFESRGNKR